MSSRNKLGAWGLLAALAILPSGLLFWLGGQDARREEAAAVAVVSQGRRLAIDHALSDERARTKELGAERDGLKRDLAATTEAALKRLRKQVADRRAALTEETLLLLDLTLSLDQLVKKSTAALPEVSGMEIVVERGARGYELTLRFSAECAGADFGPLAEALSNYPPAYMRSWVRNLHLVRPEAHRYPTQGLSLSAEAWRVLLEGYQQGVRTVSGTYVDNLYGEPKLGELQVGLSKSVPDAQTLTILGPKRVEGRVEPGGVFSRKFVPGNYLIRGAGPTKGEPIWLHVVELESRRRVKFTLEFRK